MQKCRTDHAWMASLIFHHPQRWARRTMFLPAARVVLNFFASTSSFIVNATVEGVRRVFSSIHCNKRITDSRIVTKRSGHFVPIALIGLGKLLHRLCAFDFFKGNIALQNSLQDLPFFQSHMQRLAKAWYRKGRRMLCKYQNLCSKVH